MLAENDCSDTQGRQRGWMWGRCTLSCPSSEGGGHPAGLPSPGGTSPAQWLCRTLLPYFTARTFWVYLEDSHIRDHTRPGSRIWGLRVSVSPGWAVASLCCFIWTARDRGVGQHGEWRWGRAWASTPDIQASVQLGGHGHCPWAAHVLGARASPGPSTHKLIPWPRGPADPTEPAESGT